MAKYEISVEGNFEEILAQLENDIINSGLSMQLVDESNYQNAGTKIAVRVYDKYFMRNGNRASLNVSVVSGGSEVFISAIGSGGGSGIFLNFSLGAESDLINVVAQSISRMGYKL